MVKRGIQKRGLDLIFGEAEAKLKPDRIIQVKEPIILYCSDGLNPASHNFTKYPNEMHPTMRDLLKGQEAAAIVFMYLWRLSFGFGRNYCRVSFQAVERETVVGSRKTVQRSINVLAAERFIVKGLLKSGEQDKTQDGCLYRVFTPEEIADRTTEEGVAFEDIPEKGVVILTPPEDARKYRDSQGSDKIGLPKMTPGQSGTTHIDTTSSDKVGRDELTPPSQSRNRQQPGRYGQNDTTQIDPPFKEDSLKDSLSPDPVKAFYTGIGQKRISKTKRERGNKVVQELEADGFSLEDIAYAAEWTPKNAKEEVYDMEILKHTIGEAISARSAEQQAAERTRKEADGVRAAEEERRRLEGEIQEIRSRMSEDELHELRKRADKEIRESGEYKKQFVTEMLIAAKENEILLREHNS